jgi:putative transposase
MKYFHVSRPRKKRKVAIEHDRNRRDLDLWAYANEVTLDFSQPGKPTDNGFIEAFNSKLRAECLNAHWFTNLADAREKVDAWRRDYNEVRPHRAIGYNVPIDLHIPGGATSPPP